MNSSNTNDHKDEFEENIRKPDLVIKEKLIDNYDSEDSENYDYVDKENNNSEDKENNNNYDYYDNDLANTINKSIEEYENSNNNFDINLNNILNESINEYELQQIINEDELIKEIILLERKNNLENFENKLVKLSKYDKEVLKIKNNINNFITEFKKNEKIETINLDKKTYEELIKFVSSIKLLDTEKEYIYKIFFNKN